MGYVIAAILVMLLAAGFVLFLVMNATKRSGQADPGDPGAEGSPEGIVAPDSSPAGDTTQHAGEQEEGHTVGGQDAERDSQGQGADSEHRPSDAPRVGDPGPEAAGEDVAQRR